MNTVEAKASDKIKISNRGNNIFFHFFKLSKVMQFIEKQK